MSTNSGQRVELRREGGKTAVGRVSAGRRSRAERKHLPDRLAGVGEKIGKSVSTFSQVPYAEL